MGDAGYHKDPYMALGVVDAFRDAGLPARAIDNGLSGRAPLNESLAEYETLRNEQVAEEYQENLKLARLAGPSLEALQLRAALKENQEQINLFDGTRRHDSARQILQSRESLATRNGPPNALAES